MELEKGIIIYQTRIYIYKKIYDEVTEDKFDIVTIEIGKKKWGRLYIVMSSVS